MKTAIVLGGNGFIGHHLARRLKAEGYWVRVVDIQQYAYGDVDFANDVVHGDLRNPMFVQRVLVDMYQEPYYESKNFDEVYQLAADMGGADFVFSGDHDAEIMQNSAMINLNVLRTLVDNKFKGRVFYSSSACMYPENKQSNIYADALKESDAYPANPDSEYGWEKLFSERLYLAYKRNHGIDVRIARFHNIFGPEGTWKGGREKAPAAICRKVAEAKYEVEIYGDGEQKRSFLYVDECVEGIRRLMNSEFGLPINIGSDEQVSINYLANMAISIAGKKDIMLRHIGGPQGVRGRNSDNTVIQKVLDWRPSQPLYVGMEKTYEWINNQLHADR